MNERDCNGHEQHPNPRRTKDEDVRVDGKKARRATASPGASGIRARGRSKPSARIAEGIAEVDPAGREKDLARAPAPQDRLRSVSAANSSSRSSRPIQRSRAPRRQEHRDQRIGQVVDVGARPRSRRPPQKDVARARTESLDRPAPATLPPRSSACHVIGSDQRDFVSGPSARVGDLLELTPAPFVREPGESPSGRGGSSGTRRRRAAPDGTARRVVAPIPCSRPPEPEPFEK